LQLVHGRSRFEKFALQLLIVGWLAWGELDNRLVRDGGGGILPSFMREQFASQHAVRER
jgi:hypothetical protein